MNGFIKAGIALAIVVVAILFFGYQSSDSQVLTKKALPSVRIAVSTTPLSAPFYIADKQGFFKAEGVNAELISLAGGTKCFTSLLNKEVDLATISNSVIMFNGFKHDHFTVLSSFVESDNDIKLMSLSGSGINKAHDLIGTTVGIVKGSASEYFLHTWLTLSGVDPNKVMTKAYSVVDLPKALSLGEVSAISVWEPFAFTSASNRNNPARPLDTKGLYNLSFNLVGLKGNSRNIEIDQKVLAALNRAVHYIAEHPENSQMILREKLQLSQAFIDWIWQDYLFKLSLNQSQVSSIEQQARWAIESQLVISETAPDFIQFFDASALQKIDPHASSL
ncbi:ABC transporter substrate-binding protein [Neptuniibacter sp. PT34_22]|uniref:ABC transporter substrate-binding protein n=1 Tax=Neptuniibacter sp. PT34_22 TaxID=3398205 RepID=UPI0039F5E6BA